ncbi:MAG: hypothetical protein ACLFWL_02695 [Candidatus Brocadiia bacterium]
MRFYLSFFLIVSLFAAPAMSKPPARTYKITENLGVPWQDELIDIELSYKPGQLKQPWLKAKANGKNFPCQVTDIRRYQDGSIASLKVWLMVNLDAHKSLSFRFWPAKRRPQSGIEIKEQPETILLTTRAGSRIGVMVPKAGKTYSWPRGAENIPAPIQGFLLPSGAVTEVGSLQIPFKVKSWASKIINRGPLFAEVALKYLFDTGYWRCKIRIVKGSPLIVVTEEFDTGATETDALDFGRFHTLPLEGKNFSPSEVWFAGFNRDDKFSTIARHIVDKELIKAAGVRSNWFASAAHGYKPSDTSAGLQYSLTGYPHNQQRLGTAFRVVSKQGDAIGLVGLDTGYWRNPLSIRLQKDKDNSLKTCFPVQKYPQNWGIDGFGAGSPNYTGELLFVPDSRCRRKIGIMLSQAENEKQAGLKSLFKTARKRGIFGLNSVKNWAIDWHDPLADKEWADKTTEAGKKALDYFRNRLRFYRTYGNFGVFSMGLHYGFAHGRYGDIQKVMDDRSALTKEDRRELRRLAAFNASYINSLASFPYGTGFHLNNPNMTVMACEARFLSSLLVKDHPEYKTWGARTTKLLQAFFERYTRPSGATYENPHYVLGATLGFIAPINEKMMANGLPDVFDTQRFRKVIRFTFDWLTPPDPRYFYNRTVLPLGNCSYQSFPKSMTEPLVRYFKDRHPKLARELQWVANQTYPEGKKLEIVDDKRPELKSTFYKGDGVSFRHGFGSDYETLLRFRAGDCDGHYEWETDQMIYTLYAKGQPINLNFANGYFPMFCRPWLRNRVSFDMKVETSERNETAVEAVALAPEMDYLRAWREVDQVSPLNSEYPDLNEKRKWTQKERQNWGPFKKNIEDIPLTRWYRQVMFLKDADPRGPNYFVIADGFGGTPTLPTEANFWFLAENMEREGNVLHYEGQQEVNMDVFVHTPRKFEPHTDTYGHQCQQYGALFKWDKTKFPEGKLWEEQMLLRLEQGPGENYMTVLYPRLKENDPPARFKRLGDHAVEVETSLSRDVVILGAHPVHFTSKDITFQGRAGALRSYKDGRTVILGADGKTKIKAAGKKISANGPFRVTIANGKTKTTPLADDTRLTVE